MADETPFRVFETSQAAAGNRLNPGKLGLYSDRVVYVSQPKLTKVRRQDVQYEQIAQIYTEDGMAFTTLIIETTGGDKIEIPGLMIDTAGEALDLIRSEVEKTTTSDAGATGPDLATEIERLAALHTNGALSDEEFTAAKKKALGL